MKSLLDQLEPRQLQTNNEDVFLCLRYSAVHIKIANDLLTDSFIHVVFRFVARGPPSIIYSDNETKFKGAGVQN